MPYLNKALNIHHNWWLHNIPSISHSIGIVFQCGIYLILNLNCDVLYYTCCFARQIDLQEKLCNWKSIYFSLEIDSRPYTFCCLWYIFVRKISQIVSFWKSKKAFWQLQTCLCLVNFTQTTMRGTLSCPARLLPLHTKPFRTIRLTVTW